MTNPMLAELDAVVRLSERATPGEWLTEYRKTPRGYAQEVFDAAGDTIATMAWHAVPLNETTTTTDREANAHLIAGLVNFLRTHHATLADMAKRLEAAERDAARWRQHISSPHDNHSHFCRRCAFSYTPTANESEDCPSCGFDGVDFGMIDGETRAAINAATQEGEG